MIGFGRFGMVVAQILTSEGLEITAIDNRPDRIEYARKQGYKVYYGDATRADVLSAAGAGKAALVAMCIENDKVMGKAIDLIREGFPEALIFCRATDRAHVLDLTKRGVDFQIRETFESSVVFGRAALEALGTPLARLTRLRKTFAIATRSVLPNSWARACWPARTSFTGSHPAKALQRMSMVRQLNKNTRSGHEKRRQLAPLVISFA